MYIIGAAHLVYIEKMSDVIKNARNGQLSNNQIMAKMSFMYFINVFSEMMYKPINVGLSVKI
jgi:hypothetical protein